MKKLCKIILFFCVFVSIAPVQKKAYCLSDNATYAKVLSGCYLYKTQNFSSDFDNVYFIIPESYFVVVLETINDSCFKVQYDKYVGYVDSATVEIATFIPVVKTLTGITFDIKNTSGTQIWKMPTTDSNIYTTIDAGTKNIMYIASCFGAVPTGGESNVWYFVRYTPESNSTSIFEGYVYSENTTNLTEIVANTESNSELSLNSESDEKTLLFLSSTLKTIIIAVIAIPVVLFFAIILYKLINFIRKKTISDKIFEKSTQALPYDKNEINSEQKHLSKFRNLTLLKRKNYSAGSNDIDSGDDELM